MATNPRIPSHRDVPTLVSQRKKKSSAPWVLAGIFVAAILLAAILIWLPRAPKRPTAPSNAAIPVQPTGTQVRLSDIKLADSPVGGQMYIYGRLWNAGQTAINGAIVNVTFAGQNGQPIATISSAPESFSNNVSQPLANAPVQPNQARDIRIPIQNVPAGWNHQVPMITVQDVTGFAHK